MQEHKTPAEELALLINRIKDNLGIFQPLRKHHSLKITCHKMIEDFDDDIFEDLTPVNNQSNKDVNTMSFGTSFKSFMKNDDMVWMKDDVIADISKLITVSGKITSSADDS